MSKTKKNRLPLGSPDLAPLAPPKPLLVIQQFKEDEPNEPVIFFPDPISPPLNVGEILANIKPDTMETLNEMNLAINTNTGDVLNWATNERVKLDALIKKIEDDKAEEEAKLSQKQISQKRSYLRDWWRWLRGQKD
jgi:hypothetical protein